jgi:Na+:H+ antiporter, NhaA family
MKQKVSDIFLEFFRGEKTGGALLLLCTAASLVIANSRFGGPYSAFWQQFLDLSFSGVDLRYTINHWINDGLMTVFFLLAGLEIERELYEGGLSGIRNALLPVFGALGGMIAPALIHYSLNAGKLTQSGFGIPVATDIAFALGALSLLGDRIPLSLKVLLTALAIIDDLGAITVIAFFYTHGFSALHFGAAMMILAGLIAMNRLRVANLSVYVIGGMVMWFFMLKSGVHATITGVFLAFAIPFGKGDKTSPSYRMQHLLDGPVPFFILPVFALANTAVLFSPGWYWSFIDGNTAGIMAGLVIGKPLGILIFSLAAVRIGLCSLPVNVTWLHIAGIGILGGIGFTMSIFIANLAFMDPALIQSSKVAILSASTIAGAVGLIFLSFTGRSPGDKGKAP